MSESPSVMLNLIRKQLEEKDKELARLKGGGGDGTYDSMEHRVARLESQTDKIVESLGGVREELAGLKVQVANLPDKDYLSSKLNQTLRNTGIIMAILIGILGAVLKLT